MRVREDDVSIWIYYRRRTSMFELLLGVSGIGAKEQFPFCLI